jgi:uncharacterized protein (TIGR03000 family)
MRNRILFRVMMFTLAVIGPALLAEAAQAQGYYSLGRPIFVGGQFGNINSSFNTPVPVYPPSINSPAYYPRVVNLAAAGPYIYANYNILSYPGSLANYSRYTPFIGGGAYPAYAYSAYSPLLTGEQTTLVPFNPTIPMGEFSLFNPAFANAAYTDQAYANALNAYANAAYANAYANATYANAYANATYANAAYTNAYANAAYANAYANAVYTNAAQTQAALGSQFAVPAAPAQLQATLGGGETNVNGGSSSSIFTYPDTSSSDSEVRTKRRSQRSTAYIDIRVPANADLWFQGVKTRQQGSVRRFITPPLAPDREYAYTVRATWRVNGKRVSQRHRVVVRPGDWVRLNWTSGTRGTAATASRKAP